MKYMKIIIVLKIIIIIACLTVVASASASGFIFNWEYFIVDKDLLLGNPGKKVYIDNSPIADLNVPIFDDSKDIFSLSADQNNVSTPKAEKKSVLENIKINLSPASMLMMNRHEIYSNSDDEQISKFIKSLTSLIYDDSKIKSLETMGKIIEPQINFYFEF
jgi:hypothetical protein